MDLPLFSEMLAERRRELGYSIRQASKVLRLREDVLIAFEEGDFEHMPKSGYAQGMISSYARYLGLDANEVVAAYVDDYERYKRSERRQANQRRSSSGSGNARMRSRGEQPYMGSRGLLPTSGGLAGDMGSFATTRVRTRYDSYAEQDREDFDDLEDTQARPYTNKIPARSRRPYSSNASRGRRDIETMSVEGYDDDLHIGREAQGYEDAVSRATRRTNSSSRHNANRPRVSRRSGSVGPSRSNGGRNMRRGQQGLVGSLFAGGSSRIAVIVVAVVIVLISVIIVLSVGSCVNPNTGAAKSVPVASADASSKDSSKTDVGKTGESTQTSTQTQKTESTTTTTTSTSETTETKTKDDTSSTEQETSVSVSVADGAVTWLEVECDGKSDVAETITGPWQKTYSVEDALTVQAGDTTAVSVVQNGRQVQFESMASGIGSIRIQGTKKKSTDSEKDKKEDDNTTSSDGSSAKTGNASGTSEKEDTQNTEGTEQDSYADSGSYGYDNYDYGYYNYGY